MRGRAAFRLLSGLAMVAVSWACASESEDDRTTAATGSVTSDAEAREVIRRQAARMVAIWPSENLDSIMPNFADDAVLQFPEMPDARGREAVRESLKGAFDAMTIESLETEIDTIEVFDDVAYEWGRYRERYAETGKPAVNAEGRYVMRWQRQSDGNWRVTRFSGNTVKEEPAAGGAGR